MNKLLLAVLFLAIRGSCYEVNMTNMEDVGEDIHHYRYSIGGQKKINMTKMVHNPAFDSIAQKYCKTCTPKAQIQSGSGFEIHVGNYDSKNGFAVVFLDVLSRPVLSKFSACKAEGCSDYGLVLVVDAKSAASGGGAPGGETPKNNEKGSVKPGSGGNGVKDEEDEKKKEEQAANKASDAPESSPDATTSSAMSSPVVFLAIALVFFGF